MIFQIVLNRTINKRKGSRLTSGLVVSTVNWSRMVFLWLTKSSS